MVLSGSICKNALGTKPPSATAIGSGPGVEHPVKEKGGEYRMFQIHLKINNLLLDFYEKILKELVEKSGIGERPKSC